MLKKENDILNYSLVLLSLSIQFLEIHLLKNMKFDI